MGINGSPSFVRIPLLSCGRMAHFTAAVNLVRERKWLPVSRAYMYTASSSGMNLLAQALSVNVHDLDLRVTLADGTAYIYQFLTIYFTCCDVVWQHNCGSKVRYAGYGRCYLAPRYYGQCQSATISTVVKAPLVRASLVKRRYTKYLALPFLPFRPPGDVLSSVGRRCCSGKNNELCRGYGIPPSAVNGFTLTTLRR